MNPDLLCKFITPSWWTRSSAWEFCLLLIASLFFGILFLYLRKKNKNLSQENKTLRKSITIELEKYNTKTEFISDINHKAYPPLSTDDSLHQVATSLNKLFDDLGHFEACDFITLCIQELSQTSEKINQCIQTKDRNTTKKVTHKLLGTSNLYASMKLQQLLQNIDTDMMSDKNLEQALLEVRSELTLILNYMNKKLGI